VLAREQKRSLIDQYGTHASDTGSPEVQIALLSERIGHLTEHFKDAPEGPRFTARPTHAGQQRRRLLDYLKKYDSERYKSVITKLASASKSAPGSASPRVEAARTFSETASSVGRRQPLRNSTECVFRPRLRWHPSRLSIRGTVAQSQPFRQERERMEHPQGIGVALLSIRMNHETRKYCS